MATIKGTNLADTLYGTSAADTISVADVEGWTFTGTVTFTAPGQIGTGSNSVDTFIFFTTDTDAAAEGTIRVIGLQNVDASWFLSSDLSKSIDTQVRHTDRSV
jgi:hypothetical protein